MEEDTFGVVPIDIAKMRRLREERGLTQEQAASAAGFANRQAWSLIETGTRDNPELRTLERIAAVLGVSAKDLLK